MAFFIIFFIIFFVLPKAWLSYSMNRYDNDLEGMPFNAEEFGRSILKENDMEDVIIEETNMVDHYDLNDRAVRVKEGRLKKKSLTALAIICHEIGHAIQHKEQYGPLVRRTDIVKNTLSILDKNNPEGDIKIKIIGLRPGEKLFEELLLGENTQNTLHDKIYKRDYLHSEEYLQMN